MSLGYQKGNTWVVDKVFEQYAQWDTYLLLIEECRKAGFMFDCSYSYASRKYCTSIRTYDRLPSGRYLFVDHCNAYHANPMQSVVLAIRRHGQMTPLLSILCIELECRLLPEKLLPFKRLADAMESLAETIVLGLRK